MVVWSNRYFVQAKNVRSPFNRVSNCLVRRKHRAQQHHHCLLLRHPLLAPVPTVTTAVPSLALAGFRPQPFQIHIDPELNNLVPTSDWNPESNEIMQIVGTWRTGDWSQVHYFLFFLYFLNYNYFVCLFCFFSSVRQAAGVECEGEVSFATTC